MGFDYVFEPQNVEQGISNFEVKTAPALLLRFEIPCSIFYISFFLFRNNEYGWTICQVFRNAGRFYPNPYFAPLLGVGG